MWPFNTGDCLTEVAASPWAGLTVYELKPRHIVYKNNGGI